MSEELQHDLAFLHTAQAHSERFAQLVRKTAPHLRLRHEVRPDLLERAQALGSGHPEVVAMVQAAMRSAASSGASLVVCTCSSVGGIAEQFGMLVPFKCQRIDRAMADTAVMEGQRILVVVALSTSLRATTDLLQQSANSLGREISLQTLEVSDAWAHFLAQDQAAYLQSIAQAVRHHPASYDVIVLAQASMQEAALLLGDLGVRVLSSPQLGIERALLHFK